MTGYQTLESLKNQLALPLSSWSNNHYVLGVYGHQGMDTSLKITLSQLRLARTLSEKNSPSLFIYRAMAKYHSASFQLGFFMFYNFPLLSPSLSFFFSFALGPVNFLLI
jgi:hypothetical protein